MRGRGCRYFEEPALANRSCGTAYDLRFGTTSCPLKSIPFHSTRLSVVNQKYVPADRSLFVKERPCTRCIKRNIGHLCHDEPREPTKRRDPDHSAADEEGSSNNELVNVQGMPRNVDVSDAAGQQILPDGTIGIPPSSVQPTNIPTSSQGIDANSQPSKLETRGLLCICFALS